MKKPKFFRAQNVGKQVVQKEFTLGTLLVTGVYGVMTSITLTQILPTFWSGILDGSLVLATAISGSVIWVILEDG